MLKTADSPEGLDSNAMEGTKKAATADRYAFFTGFFKDFTTLTSKRVSEEVVSASWSLAASGSATASVACVPRFEAFRKDLTRVDVPTLVIHGNEDRIVPLMASGEHAL